MEDRTGASGAIELLEHAGQHSKVDTALDKRFAINNMIKYSTWQVYSLKNNLKVVPLPTLLSTSIWPPAAWIIL